jgi:hypothetical protein
MINSSKKELTEDVRSTRGPNIDSQHFLVKTAFNQKLPVLYKIRPTLIKKWNKLNLQDRAKLKQYRKILHEKLSHINKKQGINDDWNSIKTAITETASEIFQIQGNPRRNEGWDDECRQAIREKNNARIKALQSKQGQVKKSSQKEGRRQIICVEIKRKSGSIIKLREWRKITRKMKRESFLKALKTPDNKELIQQH